MGMADPRNQTWEMTCCGAIVPWQPMKPGGRWSGNTSFEVEKCLNPRCHTNGGPEWRYAPRLVLPVTR